jgi:ABC-2 type transport system permease protein
MRTIRFLIQKEFIQIFRNKTMLPLIVVMPIVQTLLLSFAASYEVKNLALSVVDHDKTSTSRRLIERFTASGYFKLQSYVPVREVAEAELAAEKADLALEIPVHFERDWVREGVGQLGLTINALNAQKAGLSNAYANGIIRDFNRELMLRSVGGQVPRSIQVTYSNWYNPRLDYKTFMVPGILGVIVSMVIAFLTAINIVREREQGTIEQMNVTPVAKWQFILGKLLPFWLLSLVIVAVGLTVGYVAFHIPIEGSLWLVFGYTALYTPCMLGFGFLVSNFADTQQQAIFSAWFFLLIFTLMSGLFTPLDSMSEWAQWLNMVNPIHYFVAFMRLVLLKGAHFFEIQHNFWSVVGYAVVVNTLAVWTYKKRV